MNRLSFDRGWKFARFGLLPEGGSRPEPEGMEKPSFEDGAWRTLDLPHDWGIEGPFRGDLPNETGKLPWAGIGWYRKVLPQQAAGKRVYLDFDGAMSHPKVYVNGTLAGEWAYGYASFRVDLTPHLASTGTNLIAVRLDNPPDSSRWYPGGGLYRHVWLVTGNAVHLAHNGVFVHTPDVTSERATVAIAATLERRDYSDESLETILAPGVAANLTWRPTDLTRFEFNASASLAEAASAGISASKNWNVGVQATHSLRDNLDLVGGLRSSIEQSGGSTDIRSVGNVGVNWIVNPYVVLNAGYEGTFFNGAASGNDYVDHRVLTSIIVRH